MSLFRHIFLRSFLEVAGGGGDRQGEDNKNFALRPQKYINEEVFERFLVIWLFVIWLLVIGYLVNFDQISIYMILPF